jgi:hypothetical protein
MMTPANHQALVDRFVRLEDLRLRAYDDATGKELRPGDTLKGNLTIGIGRNLTGRGISSSEAMVCFEHDLADVFADLEKFPWWGPLDVVRQMAVADVRFNLGPAGLPVLPKVFAVHGGSAVHCRVPRAAELRAHHARAGACARKRRDDPHGHFAGEELTVPYGHA